MILKVQHLSTVKVKMKTFNTYINPQQVKYLSKKKKQVKYIVLDNRVKIRNCIHV